MAGKWAKIKKMFKKEPKSLYATYVIVSESANTTDVSVQVLDEQPTRHTLYNVPLDVNAKHEYIQRFALGILRLAVNRSDRGHARRDTPVSGKVWI